MSFLDLLPTNLKIQVQDVISAYPPSEDVFKALCNELVENGLDNKKRKLTSDTITNETTVSDIIKPDEELPESLEGCHIILQIPELSVQSPVRKKLNLVFACFPGERTAFLALTKSIDSKPELIIKDLSSNNIKFAIVLNVPEKKALNNLLIEYVSNMGNKFKNDPILIQFNNDLLSEQFGPLLENSNLIVYLQRQFEIIGFKLINGVSKESKSFFVESYKGSKEGHLYFLQNHIIFGFKKPILVFKSTDIDSITYTSITRLTFNVTLHVTVKDPEIADANGKLEKYEFSMIDQKEFERIDQYVKNKEFRDKSMTDELKAHKQLKNNADTPGALAEAARMIPGGEQIISTKDGNESSDDEEEDGNYEVSESEADGSDEDGSEEEDGEAGEDDDGESTPSNIDPVSGGLEGEFGEGYLNFSGLEGEEEESS